MYFCTSIVLPLQERMSNYGYYSAQKNFSCNVRICILSLKCALTTVQNTKEERKEEKEKETKIISTVSIPSAELILVWLT